jgi:transcriptional regulator with XRE-family HTH domain
MGLCIEHTKARVIASQVADPERVKRNRKRSRENRKRDPERLAIHRTFQREWARKKRGITPDRYRVAVPVADIGQCPNVPAAPFVAWLRTLGTTRLEIAHACGLSSESVNQYLIGRHQYVRLDTVDRACLYAGADLNDLYPLEDAA